FLFMVMYAPSGMAGIITAHAAPWRAGLLRRLLPGYALANVPAALVLVGLIGVVEMGYHRSLAWDPTQPTELFGVAVNVMQVWPWLVAAVMLVVGLVSLRRAALAIRTCWDEVNRRMHASGQVSHA